jgi:hypothetical protein
MSRPFQTQLLHHGEIVIAKSPICPMTLHTSGLPLTKCHSIVSQLASLLDLNTLHDLSRTCRQFRANLLQYRIMLKTLTLRCANEAPDPTAMSDVENHNASVSNMHRTKKTSGRFTSGKIGPCARDMVGECRKCSEIVCRVC